MNFQAYIPMKKKSRIEDRHIDEQLAVQLYRDSKSTYMEPWVSYYEQLDEFYEACLLNKIENERVRFFHARKMTVNECINFEKSYQSQEDSRMSRRQNHSWKQYCKKLHGLEPSHRKQQSQQGNHQRNQQRSEEELFKKRIKHYRRCYINLGNSMSEIEDDRFDSKQLLELFDHQLFHGSRTTIEFTCNQNISIAKKLVNVIQNEWSAKNLSAKSREDTRIFKKFLTKVRLDIFDKRKQLLPPIYSGRYSGDIPNEDEDWQWVHPFHLENTLH